MTAKEILEEIEPMGGEGYRRILFNHGVREPCFGVKIGDLQKIVRRVRKDYRLANELWDTGNYDAMYLAGLIADDARMTREDLQRWVGGAYCGALAGTSVASVAAGSPHGWNLALEWIDSKEPLIAVAGWATLSAVVSVRKDAELDLAMLKCLLERVQKTIHQEPDLVRYQMNAFVIALGCYVVSLTGLALRAAEDIGPVTADLGNNACQVPYAPDYIGKVRERGSLGKKRKSAKC